MEQYKQKGFTMKYHGHINVQTIKDVQFYGAHDDYIMSGSDDGSIFIWDKRTGSTVNCIPKADGYVVNCLAGHPFEPTLATSGIDNDIKLWAPNADEPIDEQELEEILSHRRRPSGAGMRSVFPSRGFVMALLNRFAETEEDGEESEPGSRAVTCVQQ
eukprot:GILK01008547.1.p2 GENE.GILK01008547.1~~GILK01008547.1.p2  ORF type:complete len:158 (-),score=35.48 GILK01008547.1:112-585(-)